MDRLEGLKRNLRVLRDGNEEIGSKNGAFMPRKLLVRENPLSKIAEVAPEGVFCPLGLPLGF
jgi:hypothetical protein